MQNDIVRGEHAKRLLEDPLLAETLSMMEEATIRKWEQAKDTKDREDLWNFYRATKLFKQYLQTAIDTGKMVEIQEDRKKRFRIF